MGCGTPGTEPRAPWSPRAVGAGAEASGWGSRSSRQGEDSCSTVPGMAYTREQECITEGAQDATYSPVRYRRSCRCADSTPGRDGCAAHGHGAGQHQHPDARSRRAAAARPRAASRARTSTTRTARPSRGWRSARRTRTTSPAFWQQDRWSDGGSHGLLAAVSHDGGATLGLLGAPLQQLRGRDRGQWRGLRPLVGPVGLVGAQRRPVVDRHRGRSHDHRATRCWPREMRPRLVDLDGAVRPCASTTRPRRPASRSATTSTTRSR